MAGLSMGCFPLAVELGDTSTFMDALKQNGYPLRFIQRHPCCSNLPRPLTLPYVSSLSETVRRILRSLDIRVAFRLYSTLRRQLVHACQGPCTHGPTHGRDIPVPILIAPKCTLDSLAEPWSTASGNTDRHSKMEMWLHRLWWSMYGPQVNLSKVEVINSHLFVTTQYLLERWHIQCHTLNREKGTLPREYMALLD